MRDRQNVVVAFLALVPALMVGACNGNNSDSPFSPSSGGSLSLSGLVSAATVGNSEGVLKQGFAPRAGAGPAVTVSGNQTVINGGTAALEVTAGLPFSRLFVTLAGRSQGVASSSDAGLGSFYEVSLPSPQTTASLLLVFPQDLQRSGFDLFFSVADESGQVGPFTSMEFGVIQVGTGDVQVALSWDTDSDVDLHVIDPNGDEVYWANPRVASGGELDLDSNAACALDDTRNENITWPVGTAPQGTYTVRVDYWSSCGVGSTDYTVIVNNGGTVEIFNGTFEGAGDRGGRGSGVLITSFDRTAGPASTGQRAVQTPETGPTSKP